MGFNGNPLSPEGAKLYTTAEAQDKDVLSEKEKKQTSEASYKQAMDLENQKFGHDVTLEGMKQNGKGGTRTIAQEQKDTARQDRLEDIARQDIVRIRGDKSLARTEEQRDAASMAYNRISQVEQSGKELNPIDYVDILGQIYKARTGTAPTEVVLNEAMQKTAKGNFGGMYTFFTGQQAPATTTDIMESLKDMALHMGKQADQFHEGYMKAHLDSPTGLEPERANRIKNLGRGISFAEATGLTALPSASGTQASPTSGAATMRYNPQTGKIEPIGQQ
jgi:hypothetical protein